MDLQITPEEQARRALAFRHRAEELRAVADVLKNNECYAALIRIAASYDSLAQTAEHTLGAVQARS